MAATDRTHLAALGFNDPDKREPDHDLACRYLARECPATIVDRLCSATSESMRTATEREWTAARKPGYSNRDESGRATLRNAAFAIMRARGAIVENLTINVGVIERMFTAEMERPLSKGAGQYKVTIGFLDVFISSAWTFPYDNLHLDARTARIPSSITEPADIAAVESCLTTYPNRKAIQPIAQVAIEVKIQRRPLADVIRQINLYREYCPDTVWALAAPWEITAGDLATLTNANISYLPLGAKFEAFKQRETSTPMAAPIADI